MPGDATTRYSVGVRPTLVVALIALVAGAPGLRAQAPPPDPKNPAERIVALDPRWTVSFTTAPSAPAGYDQQLAYVPLKGGELVAIDLNEGRVAWVVPFPTTSTPATGDGLVFAAGDGAVTALEQRTGAPLWKTAIDSPLAAALYWDTGWLLASTEAGDLLALHAQDGRILWRQTLGSPLLVPPTPAGDRLYVALRDGRLVALALDGGGIAWIAPLNEPVTGLLALEDQLLVGTRKNLLHSVSLTDGRIRWTQRAGADTAGAPVADDKLIYFTALDNMLRALDRRSGNLRWSRSLPTRPTSGPLRTGDVVLVPFVTTDIGAYTAATGQPAFTIHAVGEIGGVPFIRESVPATAPVLVAMSREGALQGFAPRVEPPPAALGDLPGIKVGS
jgi:outer membrane protein assembly factor BamB